MLNRALIGLLLALASAVWWMGQKNEALAVSLGEQRQSVAELNQAVVHQTRQLMEQQAAREATEQILAAADAARRQHQRQLAATQQQLTEALANETCADTPLPDAALEWLRDSPGPGPGGGVQGRPAGAAAAGAAAAH